MLSYRPFLFTNFSQVIIEKSTYPGQEIADTIYLKGFPQDFGQFKGKTEGDVYYSADNTELKVRLWWSGESYDGTEVVQLYLSTLEMNLKKRIIIQHLIGV